MGTTIDRHAPLRSLPRLPRPLKVALVVLGLAGLWWLWEPLSALLGDADRLHTWVESLGPLGPLTIVALGVLQVWIAPLPGYPVVLASGVLFGTWWGALWANLGILAAGLSTAYLARRLGRPLVERAVNPRHLARLEPLLANESRWFWFWILFLPTGDLPYFAAGLSRVSFRDFGLALATARLPFTVVLTWAAQHAIALPGSALVAMMIPVAVLAALVYWRRERLQRWTENMLSRLTAA